MQFWEDAGPKAQATAWELLDDLKDRMREGRG
jgi:hypothetical protein